MEHLTKLLRDSYDLQENKPEKSAYWHLQKLRSEIKQLTLTGVVLQSEQLPDENLYQPCEGCTTSCKSWEVFFCKKLVG
jgi:hypothetical protein